MERAKSLQDADWTETLPASARHHLNLRDWSTTPLGLPSTWPYALRLFTHMLFTESKAVILCWGKERTTIYNEHWIPLLGHYHPALLGDTFEKVMPPVYLAWAPIFADLERGRPSISQEAWDITQNRYGYSEESHWDGNIVSMTNDLGGYGGMYSQWTDVTKTILRDRRAKLLHQVSSTGWDPEVSIWQYIHQGLLSSPRDITVAMIYGGGDVRSGSQQMLLQRSIGLGTGHSASPSMIDLSKYHDSSLLGPFLRCARDSLDSYTIIDQQKHPVDPEITNHIEWRGFGESSRYLVVIPLRAGVSTRGYCVLGLNPRRILDEDHIAFLNSLSRELCNLVERSIKGTEDQETQLLRKELGDHERRIRKLVEVVPSGIYAQRMDGKLIWANQRFHQVMGIPQGQLPDSDWRGSVDDRDLEWMQKQYDRCVADHVDVQGDIRLKSRKMTNEVSSSGDAGHHDMQRWISFNASPEPGVHSDDDLAIMGCVIDITQQKWMEGQQQRNIERAQAEKRRLEDFIDITSHEMRNPLSAILQCAESIKAAMREMRDNPDSNALLHIIEENEDTADSILTCVAHQKRIVDDILTLSKLNSQLLTIKFVEFRVRSLIDEALLMLGSECEVNDISVERTHDTASIIPDTTVVCGDPARLMQVMVNLLTNAFKFTKSRDTRKVSIRSGILDTVPAEDTLAYNLQWSESSRTAANVKLGDVQPREDAMYLYIAITDSGIGVPANQVHKLFSRFEQGNLITFTKYGGSGLGLYISRDLVELHGGRIGISSEWDVGSTFAFYVQITEPKSQPEPHAPKSVLLVGNKQENPDLQSSLTQPNGTKQLKVLLVEDNLLNQKILAKQLRKAGCIVVTADHGGQAIDWILKMLGNPLEFGTDIVPTDSDPFDSILMDWEMPICDGLQATRRIRDIEQRSGCRPNRIIGITANAREKQIAEAMSAGMNLVVTKPFKVADLLVKMTSSGVESQGQSEY